MSNDDFDEIIPLWEKSKQLEKMVSEKRREAYQHLKEKFPRLKYKNFGGLITGKRFSKLEEDIEKEFDKYKEEIDQLENEAKRCRQESNKLIDLKNKTDDRKILDPKVEMIPPGEYPKLKKCKTYLLRKNCNYGENNATKWERCEYMKYDNSKSIFNPNRWICTAPE